MSHNILGENVMSKSFCGCCKTPPSQWPIVVSEFGRNWWEGSKWAYAEILILEERCWNVLSVT
jgi:hypothetical protein